MSKQPRSTDLSGNYGELMGQTRYLGKILEEHSNLEVPEIPPGISQRILKGLVRTRQAQVDAIRLGVPINNGERAETIEARIWGALPDILTAKGLVAGAVIQKNFGQDPDLPHQITRGFEDNDTTLSLRPLQEGRRAHAYDAIPLAVHATLIQPSPLIME